jgi:hypothetical protein
MIKRLIFLVVVLFFTLESKAHQPDVSTTLLIEQSENNWILQIRAALTAFESEIEYHYGKSSYTTPEEFQDLVRKHMKDKLSVLFNGDAPISLEDGKIKLGHESSITFKISTAPISIEFLQVTNSAFSDIPRNQSALMIIKKGFTKDQFILNNDNDHTAQLRVKDSKFELISTGIVEAQNHLLIYGIVLLAVLILLFVFIKYRPSTSTA